jgi:3-hydroxybutyryl-CoA dehydratase
VYVGATITCSWVITAIDQNGRAKASVTNTKEGGVTVLEAEISGIAPGVQERIVPGQMLSLGDPTNGLTGTQQSWALKAET